MGEATAEGSGGPLALFDRLRDAVRLRDSVRADREAVEALLERIRVREAEAHAEIQDALTEIRVAAGEVPRPDSPTPASPAATALTNRAIRALRPDPS